MAITKNLNTTYTIQTPKGSNVNINTDWVYINGNLSVLGNTTSINSTDTNVLDNVIVLNYGETGNGISKGNAGIVVDRGFFSPSVRNGNVQIRYNESVQKWEITNDGINYVFLAGSSTGLTAVVDDTAPVLGGYLNTNNFGFYANTNIQLSGNLQINNTVTLPGATVGTTTLYASTVSAGQAGLYVVNDQSANEELVTKRRAFGFSLLL